VLSAALAAGVAAKPAGPGPGNSPNAKACQKGGWQSLYTSTGQSFTSEQQCTGYAASGGTVYTQTPQQRWESLCVSGNGSVGTINPSLQWSCDPNAEVLSLGTYDAMVKPCQDAGGAPDGQPHSTGYRVITCNFD
jgi:hypothetical protein